MELRAKEHNPQEGAILNSRKKRLSLSGEPVVNLIRSWLPGALLMTIGLQTLAAFVVIHLKAAFFLEVTHV